MLIGENSPRLNIDKPLKKGKNRDKLTSFTVKECDELFNFVLNKMNGMSRTALKSLLINQKISVNGAIITQFNQKLNIGDKVVINTGGEKESGLHNSKVKIIYEDDFLIAVNKSEGLLSVSTEKKEDATAFRIVMNHLKKQNKKNRLYIVHRLDRETSGVLLFAKDIKVQEVLQNYWHQDVFEKTYYAVVEGCPEKKEDTIVSWLTESQKSKIVYSSPVDNGGQKSITHYKVIKSNDKYSLLKINLETGRKNQIRVQLQSIGHSVVGDKKYGSEYSPIGRICLHAALLVLRHPTTGKKIFIEAPIPEKMEKLLDN